MDHNSSLLEAIVFAARKHSGQTRKGADPQPYINHPLEVAWILAEIGQVRDNAVLIAAVLHDTVEDTGTTREEIATRFGDHIAGIVIELTDDTTLPREERKAAQIQKAPTLSHAARLVKIADKISNISDVVANPPKHWDLDRRLEYVAWGEKVVAGLRGINLELEIHFDELIASAYQTLQK